MPGNVSEWCWDRYADSYPGGILTDPQGPSSGSSHVVRRGDYLSYPYACRSAARGGVSVGYLISFRTVLAPSP